MGSILAPWWLIVALGASVPASAEVLAVPKGGDANAPTQTMFWGNPDAQATLILIPGGRGQLRLKPPQTDMTHRFYQALKALSAPAGGAEALNVVLFDSPEPLENSKSYPSSRARKDHLTRIGSVVRFYKQKTGTPIWLMGHSNGAVSITEFIRFDDPDGAPSLLSGLVVSGARNASYFDDRPLNFPVLFLHHENDGCPAADPRAAVKTFEQVKRMNSAPTEFRFIKGGASQATSPCESGYHMYNGAETEMDEALRRFIVSNRP